MSKNCDNPKCMEGLIADTMEAWFEGMVDPCPDCYENMEEEEEEG